MEAIWYLRKNGGKVKLHSVGKKGVLYHLNHPKYSVVICTTEALIGLAEQAKKLATKGLRNVVGSHTD